MPPLSAGLLLFSVSAPRPRGLRVLLGHPGGPYYVNKDLGSWTVPKGLVGDDEDCFDAARREFEEETGLAPPEPGADYFDLGEIRYKSGKRLRVWACEGECDPRTLVSNTFALEWPPRSGRTIEVPEVDRFEWFDLEEAERRILEAQRPLLERLADGVASSG